MPELSTLVCPDCGHDTFTVTRTTRTEYTVQWDSRAGEFELSSEVVDGGDAGDENDWTCADCDAQYPDCNPDEDLITAEAYNAEEDD